MSRLFYSIAIYHQDTHELDMSTLKKKILHQLSSSPAPQFLFSPVQYNHKINIIIILNDL